MCSLGFPGFLRSQGTYGSSQLLGRVRLSLSLEHPGGRCSHFFSSAYHLGAPSHGSGEIVSAAERAHALQLLPNCGAITVLAFMPPSRGAMGTCYTMPQGLSLSHSCMYNMEEQNYVDNVLFTLAIESCCFTSCCNHKTWFMDKNHFKQIISRTVKKSE